MPTIQGHTRIAFLCFFISHIPITLLIDSQALFPRHFYPQILRTSLDWYASTFKDELMTLTPITSSPIWFKSFVAIEIIFQLPFFFLAIFVILHAPQQQPPQQNKTNSPVIRGDGIFRSICLIYSTSTVTTLIPILVSIATSQLTTTISEKGLLLCFYLPYFIFPLWLLIIALCEENVLQSQQRSNCKTNGKEMKKMK
jgi:hypothetical protein